LLTPELFEDILGVIKTPAIISIDGNAGAGKTTLAIELKSQLAKSGKSSQIVHMDDFYDGWQNPFTIDLANRVITQILQPFSQELEMSYQAFDWLLNGFVKEKFLTKTKVLILEGVGSGQSAFRNYIDYLIWLNINPKIGLSLVTARDGTKNSQQMQQFLLDQERHFALENTQNASDWQIISVP
jgi:uridine kinase